MSKRLKLVSATEAEMEERSFVNPYPDCDQGVLTSSNSSTDSDSNELFDANGKVSDYKIDYVLRLFTLTSMSS